MSGLLVAMAGTMLFVGFKSFQQRNVAFDHYWLIPPTSMCMALTEYFVIGYMAVEALNQGFSLAYFGKAACLGLAAGAGSLLATLLHGKLLGNKKAGAVSDAMLAQGVTEVRYKDKPDYQDDNGRGRCVSQKYGNGCWSGCRPPEEER